MIPSGDRVLMSDRTLIMGNLQGIIGNFIRGLRKFNNGHLQSSVLAPLPFSLYIADIPNTQSTMFACADDDAIATQNQNFDETKKTLITDLETFENYFREWGLQTNANLIEACIFI